MSEAGVTGRRPRTPSADVERELLSAAEEVLVRDGPSGLTVRAVAARASEAARSGPIEIARAVGGNASPGARQKDLSFQ